nr:acyltransferase family protein [Terrimesophilobacter mesophilus]
MVGPDSSGRIALWDNARFLAVTLVVMGHAIQRLTAESDNALTLYLVIYAFHMPAFAIISGYFSKSVPPTKRSMLRLFTELIVPYLIMEAAWSLVKFMIDGTTSFDPTTPSWTLWFLLSLAIFRLVLPYLALLRWPLTISVVVSIGVGYLNGVDSTFSLARTLGILPFFVLGWKLSTTDVAGWWLSSRRAVWWIRAAAVGVFVTLAGLIWSTTPIWRDMDLHHWLFYDDSYSRLGADTLLAGGMRILLIALAVVLSASFLALVPRHATVITPLGRATMYVYLLHSFLLYPLRESGLLGGAHSSATWLALMMIAAVAISLVLASDPVRRLFRPIIQPNPRWLFASDAIEDDPSLPRVSSRVDLVHRDS